MESETQYKKGTEGGKGNEVKVANPKSVSSSDFLLRLLALAATLTAAIVLGVSNPAHHLTAHITTKWQYSSALVYFMVTNVIACVYAAFSMVLSIAKPAGANVLALTLIVLDLIMVALLFSANGAAAAMGSVGYRGNSHLQWGKVCDLLGKYCRYIMASIVVSLLGSLVFIMLVLLATWNLRKKSP